MDYGRDGGGGDDLARKFYEELRKRDGSTSSSLEATENKIEPSSTDVDLNDKLSELLEPDTETIASPTPKKKFTGQQSSFYSNQRPSSAFGRQEMSSETPRSPRETMMEREYQLVGRAERNIVVQAGFALLALAFYIYVGLSGGIVSGNGGNDFGVDDEIYFEEVVPLQSDREVSVWL